MSNATHTDPRENADTATEPAAAPSGTEPADTADGDTAEPADIGETVETSPAPNGHPVTSTILRHNGEACYAHDIANGGTWVYDGTLTRTYADRWRGTIRAEFAPRTDEEARNPQGRELLRPLVMEAIFYGDFREAHGVMRAAVGQLARRREAQAAHSRARKARKAAQNAPAPVDAANTNQDADERF